MSAPALWCIGPGEVQTRPGAMGEGVHVRTLFSGISRGTERLVLSGRVPASEHDRMRAPYQEGDFPFPVKYGYAAVGLVTEGALQGRHVFALHPHQTEFRLPEAALTPLPQALAPERAVLAANMETALTILWDSGAGAGDRIAVIGGGLVGLLVASLAARLPGADVTVVDPQADRAPLAQALGCAHAAPEDAPGDQDVVIHTSATEAGLTLALSLAGPQAQITEASWHGAAQIALPLGGAFHSRRLQIVSSQVGTIPPDRAPRWTYRRRLAVALDLLADDRLDALISGESDFTDLPSAYPGILADPGTLCHRIRY
ncbi:zinc-binding alcohol dehydrogenase [Paracoccus liaowanqingii]|uniref:Zinc-binding alcohol dehydrogenase n=1 Tax=Paracoccus liaowanqingii TaxID=2560053 RepID=A0A4Z1CRR9_9RHOB|nr:zinc-binding alcohol dehydrogenase [Paracoccus liaowanqingii]TGN67706.1 zinc-binding alcohol dehydrogenase [Paracoccus liaowanqingii]